MLSDSFASFELHPQILRALEEEGYTQPTPIQQAAIPELLTGRDLLATAQTGTGKTAAFALPILHQLFQDRKPGPRHIRALILTPTRELALQIDASFNAYGRHLGLRTAVVLGGVPAGNQIRALNRHPDILIATPGRLLDLGGQGFINLDHLEMLVLDEADRMLDMGFLPAVKRIVENVPEERQTMLFSATLAREIADLAACLLVDPARVAIDAPASISVRIEQQVLFVDQSNKRALLAGLLRSASVNRALVFTRTKHQADRITKQLSEEGILADSIHSNKSQNARQRALAAFDRGRIRVLVATDIVSRGIDVDGISHVINFELPNEPESYVHRIGRTARAGAEGVAISFCSADEVAYLRDIERLTKVPLTADMDHSFHSVATAELYRRGTSLPGGVGRRPMGRPTGRPGQRPTAHRAHAPQQTNRYDQRRQRAR
jgi:ATP-dependent RNA helicase RhlE